MTPEEYKYRRFLASAIFGVVFCCALFFFQCIAIAIGYALVWLMQILGG